MPSGFQVFTQLYKVVDLTIEYDLKAAVFVAYRLSPAFKVNDA
jgi:hypothetical protein